MSYFKDLLDQIQDGLSDNVGGSIGNAGNNSSTIEGAENTPEENQTAVVYDVLSEGPIEGLVDGTNSIFIDKTPVTTSDSKHQPIRIKNVAFTASSKTLVDSDSGNPFSGLSISDGRRYVRIPGGKKSITGNGSSTGVSGAKDSTIITASSSFFAADDITDINPSTSTTTEIDPTIPKPYIRIAGAGSNANVDLVTPIIRFISATSVEIGQPLPRAITHKTASVDKIGTLATITNANTATINNISQVGTASRDVSSVEVTISSPELSDENTVYNYQNFQYAFRNGLPNQPYLTGFRGVGSASIVENPNRAIEQTAGIFSSNDNSVNGGWNSEKTPDATAQPVIINDSAVSDPNEVDKVKLTFKFPSMIANKPSSGDEKPTECELRIFLEYKKTGDAGFTRKLMFGPTESQLNGRGAGQFTKAWKHPHTTGTIRSKTKTPFAESFIIDLEPYKPLSEYQIRVERLGPSTGKHGNYEHNSPCTLDTVEHRFTDKLSYPHAAYAAMIFDAETFNKVPKRSYEVKGLKVKVPTNYFPKGEGGRTSGQYDRNITSGVDAGSYQKWDGNFRGDASTFSEGSPNYELVWTDNPAWVFYDLVTNKRYGIGKYVDESQIDKYELFKIARYCDELVADGKGGTEPRFTANVYLKEAADALKVLKDITQVFRGMLYWLDGEIQFSQNRYQQPIYTFSKGNIMSNFKYTSTATQFRSNQIQVTWNDPESMYKKQVEIVEDTNNILETGRIVPKKVVAFGCTSRGQAHRFGKWTLFTEILENETVSFSTSLNAGFLKPGDVVFVQDADRDVISNSGRLSSSSSTTSINLDRSVNLSSGNTFKLSVMYPEGGAYLSNTTATINDDTGDASATGNYQRGDLVTHAKVDGTVVKITTSSHANNAVDSSGNPLDLEWNPNSRIETQTISTTGSSVSTVAVSSAFTSAPSAEIMWVIREYDDAGDLVIGSGQQYVVTEVKEEDQMTFAITAAKYEPSKFDLVDRGYILDVGVDTNKLPSFNESTPSPETLSLSVAKSFTPGVDDETSIPGVSNIIVASWGRVLNSDGTAYSNLSHFEVKHNIDSLKETKFKKLTAPKDETRLEIPFSGAGTYIVQVQAVNVNGGKSQIVQRKIEVTPDALVSSGKVIEKIPSEGKIDKHIQCSSSTVSIDSVNYKLENSEGTVFTNPSNGNTASYQQSFSGMSSGDTAYLLFDASESATSGDRLKAVKVIEDTTAAIPIGVDQSNSAQTITPGFSYLAEVGASNSGITTRSGTVSGTSGDTIITGSSTSFTTQFSNGDTIVIAPPGATRFYSKINYIENDGKLQIQDGLPRDYSGVTVNSLSLKPDPISDVILAKVSYDGSTYTLEEKYSEGTESLGYFHHENTSNTNALSVAAFKTQFGRFPQEGDILIVVNTALSPKASKSYKFSNNAFSEIANFMTGDLIVDGTIEGDKIRSDTQIIAGADDSNKQAVLDGTGTGDNALRIYAGANVANKANAPFKVTQAGALTATSATIGGAIDATTLNVVNASVVGSLTASELTAGSVTVQSLNQAVWNEIDTRVAGASANGFYDNKNSTTGYLGVSKTLSLTGSSSAGYQHNGEDLHLRFQLVDSFGPTPAGFTGDGLKVTVQFQYRLASSSTWINVGSSLTQSLTRTDYSSGALYDIDMDHDVEISSSLTTNSYYHFQVVLTPTITNNAFVAFINYNSGGANDSSGSPFHFAVQQGSTSVGSGSGTVTSVGSGDGLTGGAITGSGTLAVDSTVVRTSGTQTIAGDKTFSNDIIVTGNLDVRGTTTTLDTATLNVEDNNITLNYGTGNTTSTANGAGITIQDAVDGSNDATILWDATNDEFDFSHKVTAPALTVDNISINAEEIASTSNMTLNSGNDIILDADGGNVMLKDNSVWFGNFNHNGNNLAIDAKINDGDIVFRGKDGSSTITALTLDMSDAGTASFNHDIHMVDNAYLRMGAGGDLIAFSDGTNALINANNGDLTFDVAGNITLDADGGSVFFKDAGAEFFKVRKVGTTHVQLYSAQNNVDIKFEGVDGGVGFAALTLDMSDAGKALFNAGANFGNSIDVTGTTVTDGLTVNSGGTSSFLSIRNGSNSSFTKLYSDLNGVTVLDVDANNIGSAPRFQIDVSEVQAFRITEGGDIYFYEDTGSTAKLHWDASGQLLNLNDSKIIHNNNTFNTFNWQNYQADSGKLVWTVTGTSGAEMELSSDGSAYGNAVLSVGGQQVITTGKAQTLTNKTLTSPVFNTGVSGTAIKDEDNMASNSATHLATQQSIKAYVDSQTASAGTITGVTNFADNRILTASGATTINGEAALTFSGSTLTVNADADFNGANADLIWDYSEDELTLGGGGTIKLLDNAKAQFGAGNDLQIYHDGNNSNYIKSTTSDIYLRNEGDNDKIYIQATNSGTIANYLTIDGNAGLTKFNKNTKHLDNIKATFGNSGDLEIYHNSTSSNGNIENHTGGLFVTNYQDDGNIIFRSDNGSGGIAEYIVINGGNGSTMLKHYGSTKLETTSTGVEITGNLDSPQISINDYISHNGDSNTYFGFDSADTFSLVTGGTSVITADANTAYLRYQGSPKLFTTNGGVTVTGALTIGTNDLITEESGQLKIQSGQGVVINIDNNDSGPDLFRITKGSTGNNILQISTADNNATFTGKIYGQDTNSTTVPTFSFTGHTDSGMSLYNDGSSDYVNIISDGGRRAYFNTAGITSMNNIYTAATSAFRNYAGTWAGTTGVAGNGFYFLNNSGGNTVKAMELSAGGNVSFSGTLGTAGDITATSSSIQGTKLTLTNTNQSSSKEYTLISNATGNFYVYDDTANTTRLTITSSGAVGLGTGGTDPKMALQVEELGIDTRTSTVSSTQTFSVHDFLVSEFRSARYTIQIKNTTDSTYHVTEILLIHDGTDVYMTEYGTIFTGNAAEATFDADISVGVVRLRVTPASSDNMTFKAVCHGITT